MINHYLYFWKFMIFLSFLLGVLTLLFMLKLPTCFDYNPETKERVFVDGYEISDGYMRFHSKELNYFFNVSPGGDGQYNLENFLSNFQPSFAEVYYACGKTHDNFYAVNIEFPSRGTFNLDSGVVINNNTYRLYFFFSVISFSCMFFSILMMIFSDFLMRKK